MKNTFGKIFGMFMVCLGANVAANAATVVGQISIPRVHDGKDGCNIQFQSGELDSNGCRELKWINTFATNSCEPANNTTAWTKVTVCNGAGGSGFDACESASDTRHTVKQFVRTYSQPKMNDNGYADSVGGFSSDVTFCDNSVKYGFEADKCDTIPVITAAASRLPALCKGTVKKCTSGDDNSNYYMCEGSETCYSSTSVRTPQSDRQSDLNGAVVFTQVGFVKTTVSRGCSSEGVDTESFTREDDCDDPRISKFNDVLYTYYTCSYTDGNGRVATYTLRKPLGEGVFYDLTQKVSTVAADAKYATKTALNNKLDKTKTAVTTVLGDDTYAPYDDFQSLKQAVGDADTADTLVYDVDALKTTVDGHTSELANKMNKPTGTGGTNKVLVWGTGDVAEWGTVSPNMQLETFGSSTKMFYCTKTDGTLCQTADVTEANAASYGWASVSIASLQGESAMQAWCNANPTSSCTAENFLAGIKGEKGDKGAKGATGAKGAKGDDGLSASEEWCAAQDPAIEDCSLSDYLAAMKGADGRDGRDGQDGQNGRDACQSFTYQLMETTADEYVYEIRCNDPQQ